ncbi:unnamed protein product, partial [Phaeothamnion confervicola]
MSYRAVPDDSVTEGLARGASTDVDNVDNGEVELQAILHGNSTSAGDTSVTPPPLPRRQRPRIVMKTPNLPRDATYTLSFVSHFALTILVAFFVSRKGHSSSSDDVWIAESKASVWETLLRVGNFLGVAASALLLFVAFATQYRAQLAKHSLPASVAATGTVAVLLAALAPRRWPLAALLSLAALSEALHWSHFAKRRHFLAVQFDMVADVVLQHHAALVAVMAAISGQALFLLWWGKALVESLEGLGGSRATFLLLFFLFNFYWTTQVFLRIISLVCAGTMVAWCAQEADRVAGTGSDPDKNVAYAFLRKALSSSLGSVCKGALLCPIGQVM